MTIDVAKLRRFAEEAGWPSVTPTEFVELLDAYEERDRLREALLTIERGADHHLGIVGAPAFYEAMEWASTIANAAMEGRK